MAGVGVNLNVILSAAVHNHDDKVGLFLGALDVALELFKVGAHALVLLVAVASIDARDVCGNLLVGVEQMDRALAGLLGLEQVDQIRTGEEALVRERVGAVGVP